MVLFLVFLMNYGMVMYFVYPHFAYTPEEDFITTQYANVPASYKDADASPRRASSRWPPPSSRSSTSPSSASRSSFDFLAHAAACPTPSYRTVWKSALFFIFVLYYYFYVLMSLILLLNLLIAMMGDTYGKAIEGATLGWRVDFARRVLRLELQEPLPPPPPSPDLAELRAEGRHRQGRQVGLRVQVVPGQLRRRRHRPTGRCSTRTWRRRPRRTRRTTTGRAPSATRPRRRRRSCASTRCRRAREGQVDAPRRGAMLERTSTPRPTPGRRRAGGKMRRRRRGARARHARHAARRQGGAPAAAAAGARATRTPSHETRCVQSQRSGCRIPSGQLRPSRGA